MRPVITAEQAAELVPDGAVLHIGGFLGVGAPHRIIDALIKLGRKNLTIIGNDTARPNIGVGKLVVAGLVKKVITSHIGTNPETQKKMLEGSMEVQLVPQGTLAERIRAAGFGLGGVLTKTGLGTLVEDGKQKVQVNGETYLVEPPLRADFALIHASQADFLGNLTYQFTAHNFNPVMAMAADVVIAEPREIVPVGCLSPDVIKTPAVLVTHLVERAN